MDKAQLQISFIVSSITLHKPAMSQIKTSDMIKLNITPNPLKQKQEYIINHLQGLNNINHEFKIVSSPNSTKFITLSIRKVEKKWCFENLFKTPSKSIDPLTGKPNGMNDSNIQYQYEQLANSLLGFCKIDIDSLEIGVNNSIKVDLITKKDSKAVGEAYINIYKWDDQMQFLSQKIDDQSLNKILFEDPECYLSNK